MADCFQGAFLSFRVVSRQRNILQVSNAYSDVFLYIIRFNSNLW